MVFRSHLVISALIFTLSLALVLRRETSSGAPVWFAFGCIALTQVVFWSLTFPVNRQTKNWTTLPDNWTVLRAQWEYSHAASAVLTFAAFVALIVSLLRRA